MKNVISNREKTVLTSLAVLFVMIMAVVLFAPDSEAKACKAGNCDYSNNNSTEVTKHTYRYAYKYMVRTNDSGDTSVKAKSTVTEKTK